MFMSLAGPGGRSGTLCRALIRPISLLRLSLLRLLASNFPGMFPTDLRIPPRNIKILLEPNPLNSRILVGRLAVVREINNYTKLNVSNYGRLGVPISTSQAVQARPRRRRLLRTTRPSHTQAHIYIYIYIYTHTPERLLRNTKTPHRTIPSRPERPLRVKQQKQIHPFFVLPSCIFTGST